MGHLSFPAFNGLRALRAEKAITLLHGAPEAGEMVDVKRIALSEVEVEEAAAKSGGSG